jgi:hypothetical protein
MSDPVSPVIASYPLTYWQGSSFAGITLTWYPNGDTAAPFDWTGWTAVQTFWPSVTSVGSPTLTLAVTLGGALGTVLIPALTSVQVNAMYAAWRTGVHNIKCTRTSDGFVLLFIAPSQVLIQAVGG